jgi:hypothetical protein
MEKLGSPYDTFPLEMATYGGGGVAMWGSICGACNGAAFAVSLFQAGNVRTQIISEVFNHYENDPHPQYKPAKMLGQNVPEDLPTSVIKSIHCHSSIVSWYKSAGDNTPRNLTMDRCGRLVADVALKTVTLLNQAHAGEFKPTAGMSETAVGCMKCHSMFVQNKEVKAPSAMARMNCEPCHDAEVNHLVYPHPKK